MRGNPRKFAVLALVIMLLLTPFVPSVIAPGSPPAVNLHPQPGIWEYQTLKNQPTSAYVLSLEQKNWQAITAACLAPVFYDRTHSTPLLLDDGTETRTVEIPHETKAISDFGSDAQTATGNIATTYWSKAEIVLVADNYEDVLLCVPTASFLSAPILVNPSLSTLETLGAKCAIVLGDTDVAVEEVIRLEDKSDVWKFQLELYYTKGQKCNYLILTNPRDADDQTDPNISYPFQSLATAPLAAFRCALVQTGDFTAVRSLLNEIHKSTQRDDELYEQVEPSFNMVKSYSHASVKFMMENGHTPVYLALVGGPFALPDYYYDIHTEYLYWGQEVHYVPSASPYASYQEFVPNNLTVDEDMGVGRIVAHSIIDSTIQLARTFFYEEFLPRGPYNDLASPKWENSSIVVDGHRLNQPRNGGPPQTSSAEPFFPAWEIYSEYHNGSFSPDYIVPQNKSDPFDENPSKLEILDCIQNYSMIQLIAHGGSMANPGSMWLEGGYDLAGEEENNKHKLYPTDISELDLAPSIVYVIACHTGHIFLDMNEEDLFPLGFTHAGAVSYIAPVTCQSICFWENAPRGVAASQAIYFWENLLNGNTAVGSALADAKSSAYGEWNIESDPRDEPDSPAFHLFGDPAFEPYKPDVPFDSREEFNIKVSYNEVKPEKDINIEVAILSLSSGEQVTDAQVVISFNGGTSTGDTASYKAPKEGGEYDLDISAQKQGYNDLNARYVINIEGTEEGNDQLPIFGIIAIIAIVVIVVATVGIAKKRIRE